MGVIGFWRSWLLPLILLLILSGASWGWGTESVAPQPTATPAPTEPVPAEPEEPPAPPVPIYTPVPTDLTLHAFRIVGAQTVSQKLLKKELSMQLPSFWPPWGKPPPFRPQDLEYDVERLKNFYRRQGFYHTAIKPEISYGPKGAVDVTLKIDEGPWVKVTAIDIEIAGPMDLSDLQKKWPLNPGDRFAEKPYDDLKNLYLNYLPNHGYPKVKVRGRVYLNPETNIAKILLTINPGPLCYFGR
jgi:outer membrane protein assembly factor BamA